MTTLDMLRSCSLCFLDFFSIFYNIFDEAPLLHTINQPIKLNQFYFDVQYLSKYFEKYSNAAYFFSECERMKSFQKPLRCCLALIKTQINLGSLHFDLCFDLSRSKILKCCIKKIHRAFACVEKSSIFFSSTCSSQPGLWKRYQYYWSKF